MIPLNNKEFFYFSRRDYMAYLYLTQIIFPIDTKQRQNRMRPKIIKTVVRLEVIFSSPTSISNWNVFSSLLIGLIHSLYFSSKNDGFKNSKFISF